MATLVTKVRRSLIHEPGALYVQYTPDGKHVVSASADGTLRVNPVESIVDPDTFTGEIGALIKHHKTPITCLAVSNTHIVTGSKDSTACLFSIKDNAFEKILLRSTLPIRSVAFHPDGKQVAIASEESSIKIIDVETISNVTLLSGHSGPVKSVAFDALGEFLISAGCDETLRIWNVKTGESIKTLERTISPFDVEDMDPFVMAWHKSGKYVAIPGRKSDIVLIQRNSWTVLGSFKNGHIQAIVDVQWSHDGKYLASIGNDKKVCIWKMGKETKDPIATETHSAKLTGVAWCTQTNTLCLSDDQGRILYWENPTEKTTSSKKKEESGMDVDRFFDDQAASTDGDDEDGEDDGVLDDFIVDDDGAGYDMDLSRPAEFKKYQEQGKKKALKDLHRGNDFSMSRTYAPPIEVADIQECIQPGSTPMQGNRRYLAFTTLGIIYTIDNDTHSSVSVEFHDRSQRPFHFTDHNNFDRACLGESGALFANEATGSHPSTVFFKPFDSWSSKADWTVQLSEAESVKALAITGNGAVVATDQHMLRFFSFSGIQTSIRCLGGPIVGMVGTEKHLFVVFKQGASYHKEQNLGYFLMEVGKGKVVKQEKLPLSPDSILTWLSFSDYGIPFTFDSRGIGRAMNIFDDEAWVPVFDSRTHNKDRQESYWPVGVNEKQFYCIICKGVQKYPGFPKPILCNFPLQVPFLQLETTAGGLEEKWFNLSMQRKQMQNFNPGLGADENIIKKLEIEMDKSTLLMIQNACQNERVRRAQELCVRLHAVKSLDGAIKLAVHHRLPALAEKMNQIKERKLYEPDEMDDIPSSFDIKSFIKDEMEKQKNDIVIASSFSLPDKPVTRTSQNYSSGPLDRVSDISSLDHSIDPVFPDTEEAVIVKKKKSSKPLNPFSISNAPKVPKASNGSNLLSAIAKSAKSEDIEKMPMVNEKKRKNQTSHLQFSKKKEAKSKDESTSKNALIAEKENFVKSVKSVSAFFSSVKTLSPAKETPIEEAVETQPDEQEVE